MFPGNTAQREKDPDVLLGTAGFSRCPALQGLSPAPQPSLRDAAECRVTPPGEGSHTKLSTVKIPTASLGTGLINAKGSCVRSELLHFILNLASLLIAQLKSQ